MYKKITKKDINVFADISGDRNPVHLKEEFADDTVFGNKIVHGIWTTSPTSDVIGEKFPGHGIIYLQQTSKFFRPIFPNQVVKTTLLVTSIDYKKRNVCIECESSVGGQSVLGAIASVSALSRKQIK
tara:strand:+ start:336 stop:716 length:381 start_codon:yes stop_codon:yes gene_type:complete